MLLEFVGVTKRYSHRVVLRDIDWALDRGECALITGANGAGKTTLLRVASTYAAPSKGLVRHFDGADADESVRRRIGLAAHQPLLYDELTVRENLEWIAKLHGTNPPGVAVDAVLDEFELTTIAGQRVGSLSAGQRQRAALARAFVHGPDLVLLDEPLAALDAGGRSLLLARLRRDGARRGIAIATHDPESFRPLAPRLLRLEAGRLLEAGR